ncbi:MAG: hypothetical protein JWN15_1421 [Firmicutes bacterium]|nr:hypothetical protein [Bacillota bacterium]
MYACPHTDEAISYSLRQMTRAEEQRYQAHIAACPPCRLKLSEVAETLELLPFAVPAVEPPPQLRAKLLDRIKAEPRQTATPKKRRHLPAWGAAAAAVALIAGSYGVLRVAGVAIPGVQQAAATERSVSLVGTQNAQTASGKVLVARERNGTRISLHAEGLPPLSAGEAYQLWLVKDGKRTSGGVFVIDAHGQGGCATWLTTATDFDTLGVTREPDALGLQPRGPKVMGSAT